MNNVKILCVFQNYLQEKISHAKNRENNPYKLLKKAQPTLINRVACSIFCVNRCTCKKRAPFLSFLSKKETHRTQTRHILQKSTDIHNYFCRSFVYIFNCSPSPPKRPEARSCWVQISSSASVPMYQGLPLPSLLWAGGWY